MADNPAPSAATVRTVNLFRRFASIMLALVGLIFLIVGCWLLASQGWDRATGTVGQCETRTTRTGPNNNSTRVEQNCDVTWEAGGASHHAGIGMGRNDAVPGDSVDLRVNGEQAVLDSPVWVGAGSAGLGAVLIAIPVVMTLRARRRPA